MKKGIVLFLLIFSLLTSITHAYSIGGSITRIQKFPSEIIREQTPTENVEKAPPARQPDLDELTSTTTQLMIQIDELKTQLDSAKTELSASETQTQTKITGLETSLAALKTAVDSLQELKRLRAEIPPLLEEPREIIPPKILVYLTAANAVLLALLIFIILLKNKKGNKPHAHPELTGYVQQHLRKGIPLSTIRDQLLSHDWDANEIDKAIHAAQTA